MEPVNRFALKEWAAVCAALAQGRQSILLRKGGIEDAPGGFRVQHPEFWLYPTRFHQQRDELLPEAAGLLDDPTCAPPPDGTVALSLYGVVEATWRIEEAEQLPCLDGLHLLTAATVRQRFDYREPGLVVLLVRVWRRDEPFVLAEAPHFAGCHSWVDLRNKLPTTGLAPVLDDAEFAARAASIRSRMPCC